MGRWCINASSFIFDRIIIKVTGNQDRHKSSIEFDFGPNQTTHFGVTCPWVTKFSHFWTWISLKPVGQSWSNFMCSVIGVREILHKVSGQTGLKLWFPWHGNRKPPLTYNRGKDVSTFSRLFLIRSFLAHLYVSTGRAIAVTTASALASTSASALLKMLKFVAKVYKTLYLLNPWMNLVDTLPDFRYSSDGLCCTITTHIGDLEVNVTDFEILS